MKRMLLGLASLLGAHAAAMLNAGTERTQRRSVPTSHAYKGMPPNWPRWWHNAADPAQGEKVLAAKAKRERKADRLQGHTNQSWNCNYTHHNAFHTLNGSSGFIEPLRLNPFYVAK